jgi:hypothetical protein
MMLMKYRIRVPFSKILEENLEYYSKNEYTQTDACKSLWMGKKVYIEDLQIIYCYINKTY